MGFARVPKPGSWSPLARDCPHPLSYAPATLKRPTKDGEKNMTRLLHLLALPLGLIATAWSTRVAAQSIVPNLEKEIRQRASQIESKLIAWRRDIHQYPELAEQETRTSGLAAEHLGKLGLEVKTGVARTGVIAILKGERQVSRARSRCHARLRTRRSHSDPNGDGRDAQRFERQTARRGEIHLPACRRGPQPLSPVRWQNLGRQGDDQGRRAARSKA